VIAVDTSALVAIALREDEAVVFAALLGAGGCKIGGPTLAEARIVIGTKGGAAGLRVLDEIVAYDLVSIEPFTERHAAVAHDAHQRFGKGRVHPAQLNICDCFSYAVASCDDLPLLFKGDDFTLTDIRPAWLP